MLNVPFCFIKILFIKLSRLLEFCHQKRLPGGKIVLKYYRSAGSLDIDDIGHTLRQFNVFK